MMAFDEAHGGNHRTRRLKVLVLASWFPQPQAPIGGIFIKEQALALAAQHDVAVLAPRVKSLRPATGSSSANLFELDGLLVATDDAPGAPGSVAGSTSRGSMLRRGYRTLRRLARACGLGGIADRPAYAAYLRSARDCYSRLERSWGPPDLIHAHVTLPGGWAGLELAQELGVPLVLTEHLGRFELHLDSAVKRSYAASALAQASQVIAVSSSLAQRIERFTPRARLTVIPNMVHTSFFRPAEPPITPDKPRFLFVGLLTEVKGVAYLLQAVRQLQARGHSDFEMVIAGEGALRLELEQQAARLGIGATCQFLGELDRQGVLRQMQQCTALVLPSLRESFGIVLVEALACGKPVVATRCGGPESIVTPETGQLVEPANPGQLADALERHITDEVAYDPRMLRQSVLERFSPAVVAGQISEVYRAALT